MTFKAQINPVFFYLTKYTRPYLPFPSYFNLVKSSTVTFLGFALEAREIYLDKFNSRARCARLDSKVGSTTWLLFISEPLYLFKKDGICLWLSIFYSKLSFLRKLIIPNSSFLKIPWGLSSGASLSLYCLLGIFLNKSFLIFELSSGTSMFAFSPIIKLFVIELRFWRFMPWFCTNPYCTGRGDLY